MPLNALNGHLKKGRKRRLAKSIFHFLNADASRSRCSFKSEKARSKFERRRCNASPVSITKLSQNLYDLQKFEGCANFVTILIKQLDIKYVPVKIN